MTKSQTLKALLFDLDGTLLDSFTAHYRAYETVFAELGVQVSRETFLQVYTPDWYQIYRTVGLPERQWELADQIWLEAASDHEPELFTGVEETLRRLQKRYRLGLVTSGSRERVNKDLTRTGIGPLFQVLVTANDINEPKPAPEGLHIALNQLGLGAQEAVYVGDTEADYRMARAAGMDFIWVSGPFSKEVPDSVYVEVNSVNELITDMWLGQ